MEKSIRLSPKHGVNPTIPRCFFCGKEKNEIALMGKLKNDAEAPKNCILDYIPCEECQKKFTAGILCVGVRTEPYPDHRPPIADGLYPTGAYVVATEDFIRRIADEDTAAAAIQYGRTLIDNEILTHIQQEYAKLEQ